MFALIMGPYLRTKWWDEKKAKVKKGTMITVVYATNYRELAHFFYLVLGRRLCSDVFA